MMVQQLVPNRGLVEVEELLRSMTDPGAPRPRPFSDNVLAFCDALSRSLLTDPEAKSFPELQALGFWMRRAEVLRLKADFAGLETPRVLLMPRGLVFHLPPANVDTIFIYSWLLAALTGNRNIVRLSSRDSVRMATIVRLFNKCLEQAGDAGLRDCTVMVSYGHDAEITSAISAVADVRVIWGGDETVSAIRAIPLPPHAREITFPDRYSLCAIKAGRYIELSAPMREELARLFFNDNFWFDQMACSSARLVAWCGSRAECEEASRLFFSHLQDHLESRNYALATGAVLNKLAFCFGQVMDRPVSSYRALSNELTVMTLDGVGAIDRRHCGAGMFLQLFAEELGHIGPVIERRDQTLTHFGFEPTELTDFARSLNGKGIDRMAPVGQALNCHRYWDGYDLLQETTRRVYVDSGGPARFPATTATAVNLAHV